MSPDAASISWRQNWASSPWGLLSSEKPNVWLCVRVTVMEWLRSGRGHGRLRRGSWLPRACTWWAGNLKIPVCSDDQTQRCWRLVTLQRSESRWLVLRLSAWPVPAQDKAHPAAKTSENQSRAAGPRPSPSTCIWPHFWWKSLRRGHTLHDLTYTKKLHEIKNIYSVWINFTLIQRDWGSINWCLKSSLPNCPVLWGNSWGIFHH